MSTNTNKDLIIYDYDDKYSQKSQFSWPQKEDSIIDKLSELTKDTKIDVEQLRSRIHIAVHKNIFEMDLTKKDSQDEQAEAAAIQVTKEED